MARQMKIGGRRKEWISSDREIKEQKDVGTFKETGRMRVKTGRSWETC